MTVAPDDVLRELYAAPPDDFVRERGRLARALRDAGQKEEADDVAGRRKPSLPVFAANALARERARDVRALLEAAEQLRRAHGKGAPDALRDAQTRLGDAVRSLVAEAADVIGRPLSEPHEQRLATTLREAALDPEASRLLARGVLPEEVEASGFELLSGLRLPRGRRRPTRPAKGEPKARRDGAKAKKPRDRLEQELSDAKRALRDAKRAHADAERTLARAQKRVEQLESRTGRVRDV